LLKQKNEPVVFKMHRVVKEKDKIVLFFPLPFMVHIYIFKKELDSLFFCLENFLLVYKVSLVLLPRGRKRGFYLPMDSVCFRAFQVLSFG